jgi:hypothetical protein
VPISPLSCGKVTVCNDLLDQWRLAVAPNRFHMCCTNWSALLRRRQRAYKQRNTIRVRQHANVKQNILCLLLLCKLVCVRAYGEKKRRGSKQPKVNRRLAP